MSDKHRNAKGSGSGRSRARGSQAEGPATHVSQEPTAQEHTAEEPTTNDEALVAVDGTPNETRNVLPFPVVGIGASAGGLDACTQLLRALPAQPGAAFVLVQ